MRKNNLFITLSIISALSFFITAAICNFCGIKIDTAPSEESEIVSIEETTSKETNEEVEIIIEETNAEELIEDETITEGSEEDVDTESSEPESSELNEIRLDTVYDETGIISIDTDWFAIGDIYVGDDQLNRYINAYISFDITDLAGAEVVSATLMLELERELGDRSYLGNLRIGTLDYGAGTISASDRNIPAKMLIQFPNNITDIIYSSDGLADELQKNINALSERFQLKVYWSNPHTDEDGIGDALVYLKTNTHLIIQYN